MALLMALALYGGLAGSVLRSQPSLESWSAQVAARIHADLRREQLVDLKVPSRPPPPPPEPVAQKPVVPPPPARSTEKVSSRAPHRTGAPRPPPPAQAGAVVAQAVDPNQPVDLTGNIFIQGTASTYAGGVTTSSGTSTAAVHTRKVAPAAPPGVSTAPSRARSVQLEEEDWSCPWPPEADDERIDEQTAVVQVVVDADGRAESAVVLADPGFGFGHAAVECARRARYTPALDSEGQPIRSKSPPLRVRFTR